MRRCGEPGTSGPRLGRVEHVTPTNYALAVAVFAGSERLDLEFNYDRARFDEAAVLRLRDCCTDCWSGSRPIRIGRSAISDRPPMTKHGESWTGAVQRVWRSPASYVGVVAHIEAQAAQAPSAVAIVWGDQRISYGELNARANRLARRLRLRDVGPDRLVGLALARSPEMMVALLAVLKAGGAYLPLDPDYPAERLAHMLRDSGATLVLTQSALLEPLAPVLRETGVEAWCLDEPQQRVGDDAGNLDVEIHPDSLAYVIYTSGSTGMPKGVAVSHGPLAMHCEAIGRLYRMTSRDREFQSASINFDIAHERWLVPLMTGGSLVLPSRPGLLIDDLVGEIERNSVTSIFLPPAYADQLSAALRQSGRRLSMQGLHRGRRSLVGYRNQGASPGGQCRSSGQRLWPDRDGDRADGMDRRRHRVDAGSACADRTARWCQVRLHPRRRPQHRAGWRHRRAVHRWPWAGAGLSEAERTDGGTVRPGSVRRRRRSPVPDRRSRAVAGRRRDRICRPRGPTGKDPRLPYRVGRDRSAPAGAARRARRGRGDAREQDRASVDRLCERRAGARRPRIARCASRPCCRTTWCHRQSWCSSSCR